MGLDAHEKHEENEEHAVPGTDAYVFAGLGALGVAVQNYQAVAGFLTSVLPASRHAIPCIQAAALGLGGVCSGMVNFWMNLDLLKKFFKRVRQGNYPYKNLDTTWDKVKYIGGIFVFVVTGILFGLMAFTFAMEGPLAILSVMVGLFVAAIMTIQEVETFLDSYNQSDEEEATTNLQLLGKCIGHFIALGNVVALSLLFTLSLAQSLMMLSVAALPAVIIGFSVAFTFGAFTEYYFYDAYLSNFCKNFGDNWHNMMARPDVKFGLFCVSTNAFVNAALTYSALALLTTLLLTAGITLPAAPVIMAISVASSFFAGSASFILGMDFWIKAKPTQPRVSAEPTEASLGKRLYGLFPCFNASADVDEPDAAVRETCYLASHV